MSPNFNFCFALSTWCECYFISFFCFNCSKIQRHILIKIFMYPTYEIPIVDIIH